MKYKTLLSMVAFAGITQMASAATVTWTGLGTSPNSWADAGNWSSDPLLPGNADQVVIPSTYTVNFDLSSATIGSLDVVGTLNIQGTKTLTMDGAPGYNSVNGDNRVNGTINLQSSASKLQFTAMNHRIFGSGSITGQDPAAVIEIANNQQLTSQMLVQGDLVMRVLSSGTATFVNARTSASVEGRLVANGGGVLKLDSTLKLDDVTSGGGSPSRPSYEVDANSVMEFRHLQDGSSGSAPQLKGNFVAANCGTFHFFQSVDTTGNLDTGSEGYIEIENDGDYFLVSNHASFTPDPFEDAGIYRVGTSCPAP